MIIGTKEFVDKIRSKYMPDHIHKEIPQQRSLGKSVEPEKVLEKAAGIRNCDLDDIRHLRRISRSTKDDRDLLVYLIWKTCMLPNKGTGRLFGMTYSAVSHILRAMRTRMEKEPDFLPIFQENKKTIEAGAYLLKARYLLDSEDNWEAFKNYMKGVTLDIRSLPRGINRIAYSLLNGLIPLEKLKENYLHKRTEIIRQREYDYLIDYLKQDKDI